MKVNAHSFDNVACTTAHLRACLTVAVSAYAVPASTAKLVRSDKISAKNRKLAVKWLTLAGYSGYVVNDEVSENGAIDLRLIPTVVPTKDYGDVDKAVAYVKALGLKIKNNAPIESQPGRITLTVTGKFMNVLGQMDSLIPELSDEDQMLVDHGELTQPLVAGQMYGDSRTSWGAFWYDNAHDNWMDVWRVIHIRQKGKNECTVELYEETP